MTQDNSYCTGVVYFVGSVLGTTVAGTSTFGNLSSQFYGPTSIFVDSIGSIYITDSLNYRVQKWIPGQLNGTTVAGGQGMGTTLNKLGVCYGVFVDFQFNIYISDYSYHRVVMWTAGNTTIGRLVCNERLLCMFHCLYSDSGGRYYQRGKHWSNLPLLSPRYLR